MSELSEETIDLIAERAAKKTLEMEPDSRFNDKEAEWVHTGAKYFPSDKFPLAGKILKMLDESAYELGKGILKILFLSGVGGIVVFILHKLGVFK